MAEVAQKKSEKLCQSCTQIWIFSDVKYCQNFTEIRKISKKKQNLLE